MGANTYWTWSQFREKAVLCKAKAVTNNEENVIISLTGSWIWINDN